MQVNNSFGQKVLALRHHMGKTQKEFALFLGRSTTTICDWEKGRHKPSPNTQKAINSLLRRYE